MRRHFAHFWAALVLTGAMGALAGAEDWVVRMFDKPEHDFGTVARGADAIHRFPVKNRFRQQIRLVSVSSSCGCTTATIENDTLDTHEVGYVVANFNTRTFTGVHSATLTLKVEWKDPSGTTRIAEGQLRVHGNVRGDVVFKPGAVKFDGVDQGKAQEERVRVSYAGPETWKVTDVRSESDLLEVELVQVQRGGRRVDYDLVVRLKDDAPAGHINEQLILVTNDRGNPRIPLPVVGRVVPEISIAPETVFLGNVASGQEVVKKILVRGKKPFRITGVECDDECFTFKTPDGSSQRHVVEIRFAANGQQGEVKKAISIATDLGENYGASCTAFANVIAGDNARVNSGNVRTVAAEGL